MLDELVKIVKEHLGNNPQIAAAIPPGQEDAVHHEVASQLTNSMASQASSQGGIGGLLAMFQNGMTSGSPVSSAITGGLISSITSKFGLPPMVTGAIAGALPGILQKLAHKAADPNDSSVTNDSITNAISGNSGGGGILSNLGGLFK